MKRIYQKPEMDMRLFEPEDIITSSSMGNGGNDDWNQDNGKDHDDFFQGLLNDNIF